MKIQLKINDSSSPTVQLFSRLKLGMAIVILIMGALQLTSIASVADPSAKILPKSLQQKVEKFRLALLSQGFEVAEGDFHLFSIEDCKYAVKSIGNCLGNNPTAPYIIPSLPLWPDEHVDPHMNQLLGPIAENQGWTHRLGEQEALVVLGELPPPGRYFGFQPYIFSREGQLDEADVLFQSLTDPFMKSILFMKSPNPSRPLVFSSIGDSINNVVIEHQSGAAFGEQRFFIMTPDAGLEKEMRQVLLQSGVPDTRHIFKAPIPASFAKLGLNSSADDFMTVLRYALPEDEIAGDQWRQQLPLVVFRVRSHERNQIATPYSVSVRETRSVRSELNLQHSLDKLVVGLKNRWAQMNSVSSEFRSLLLAMDLLGEHCIKRPMNCLGDTADADYQISETASVDQDEILAVAGTLGTVTGNATYTSLAVNRIPELIGVSNLTDKDLKGTASDLFPGSQDSEKLYLVYFARDCGNMKHCHPITEAMVPHGDQLKFIQRNYVVPGTTRGPAPGGLVNPKMIVLKKMH